MPAGETTENILTRLHAGETVLTPNQRAARTLRRAYDQSQSEPQWAPPKVLAADTWLATLWHQLLLNGDETRLLLNRTQQHALWRAIIAADNEALRSPDTLAELAAEAWASASAHNGRQRLREIGISTDTRAFERWALAFEIRCQKNGYLAQAQLPEALGNHLAEGTLPIDQGLTLVDFDHPSPALDTFFEQLDRAGYPIMRLTTAIPATRQLLAADDDHHELQSAAHWARELLAANPATRIALVASPDRRFQIERAFAQILAPQAQPITAAPTPPLYEFSLGQPLSQLVTPAIDLLRWTLAPLPLPNISALLLLGNHADFDLALRRTPLLRPELSLEAFQALSPIFRSLHRTAKSEQLTTPRPHHDWADTFRTLLDSAPWSPPPDLRRRWDSALDELATLDFDAPRPTATEALQHLTRIAAQTIFAPPSTDAPIQILGPLELGGRPFDALWFLAADDLSWPPATAPSPLLPWATQQSLGMPGADTQRDRRHARALTDRVAASAAQVVFSYARHSEEGARRPSPLLAELALIPLTSPEISPPATPVALEIYQDTAPIAPLPDYPIRGGAGILKAQAACAFRAFAERRLQATSPETSEAGLNPSQRGQIVHDIMEHFWAQVHDQPHLQSLPLTTRHELLERCIDDALAARAPRAQTSWDDAYLNVQRERLSNLLVPWLEVEAARPPFRVLQQERNETDIALGPLRLNFRVDRIDETEFGTIILDYKTGIAAPSQWLSTRPEEPQLPLYAILADPAPAGIAFALLRPGKEMDLKGFAQSSDLYGRTAKNDLPFEAQMDEWRRILNQLASDFANGIATVAPKCYPNTCKYCSQRILCRLDLTTLDDIGDEDTDQQGESTDA